MADKPAIISTPNLAQYKNVPALAPPKGVLPDFAVHNARADLYIILGGIMLTIVYLFIALRMYSKIWVNHTPGIDDLAGILGTVGLTAVFGLGVSCFAHGVGKHQWDVPVDRIPEILSLGKYIAIILPPATLFIKLSLLLLYLRVFKPDKLSRYLIYLGIFFCCVAYTILIFLGIFADVEVVIKGCLARGAVNLSSDIYIVCVPVMAAMKLKLSLKKKIGLILMFLTGTFACIMSVISLVFRLLVAKTHADATYLLSTTVILTTLENDVALMCACMPFFPAIIKRSSKLQRAFHSIHSISSSLGTGRKTNGKGDYQKHVTRDSTTQDPLEMQDHEEGGRRGDVEKALVVPEIRVQDCGGNGVGEAP